MPIKTTLVIFCSLIFWSWRHWSTISPVVRFLINPIFAVSQKSQSTAHPTCVDKQTVILFPSIINTDSNKFPSNNSKRIFCVCFETDTSPVIILSGWIGTWASFSRNDFERSVIAETSSTCWRYIQSKSCRPRNGFSPWDSAKDSKSGIDWPINGLYFNFTVSDMNWNFRINIWIFNGKLF